MRLRNIDDVAGAVDPAAEHFGRERRARRRGEGNRTVIAQLSRARPPIVAPTLACVDMRVFSIDPMARNLADV